MKKIVKPVIFALVSVSLLWGCILFAPPSTEIKFTAPKQVTIEGYTGDIMEPFLSRDGKILFFNNLNSSSVNTNLYYAKRIDDVTFSYEGEIGGDDVNTDSLEATASMDENNNFFFISTRSYNDTLSTIYTGVFNNGTVSDVKLVEGISKNKAGWIDFGVEISANGNDLFFSEGRFDRNGGPYEADIIHASKVNGSFKRADDSILMYVNSLSLEYAGYVSSDLLEIYFTRIDSTGMPQIYTANRKSLSEPFGKPYKIKEITGFVEAPAISISSDGIRDSIVYYHKKVDNKFTLWMVRKQQ